MRNTALICRNCIYQYLDDRGNYKCEKSGKRIYWNQKTCPNHVETAKSYWKEKKGESEVSE